MTAAERLARLPKAELHCHIEGTAAPELVQAQAQKYGLDVSGIVRDHAYVWHDFTSFLRAYDRAASVFRTPEDYALLAERHLLGLAAAGTLYAEIFVSPDHARSAGLGTEPYLSGLAAGIAAAQASTGIVARMVVVGVRHLGADAVEAVAREAAGLRHPLVTGFGLAGDERVGRAADFARAFDIARDAGLGLTAHAGEFAGAASVRDVLDHLRVARIGHGVRAIEDEGLVRRLCDEGIVLEVCPLSNLSLGLYGAPAAHPLARLRRAGCRVTLGTDDPPFFGTSMTAEYAFARDAQGFDEAALIGCTRTAIEAGFLDADTRKRLLDRLVAAAISLGASGACD